MALWTLANGPIQPIKWGNVDDIANQATAASWPNRGSQSGDFGQSNADWTPKVSPNGIKAGVPAIMFDGNDALEAAIALTGKVVSVFAIGAYTGSDGGKRLVSLNTHNADYNDDGLAAIMKCSGDGAGHAEIERNGTTTTGTQSLLTPCLINTGFDGTAPFLKINGVPDVVGAADSRAFTPTYITLGAWYLFGSSPVDCWTGPMSDVAVYDTIPTGDFLDRVEASLLWSRQLQNLVRSDSAYRNAAPTTGPAAISRRRPAALIG